MDIQRLLIDHNIPFATEGQHSTEGWVNVHCPFCAGSREFHLGLNEDGRAAHCWRCGSHPIIDALSHILELPPSRVRSLLQEYRINITRKRVEPKVAIFPLKFPSPNSRLTSYYKRYLERRNFDPRELEAEWEIRQTGPVSTLDGIPYSHRILIPIRWNGEVVTFQARDITEKSPQKYLACPKRREKIHHKDILYGKQEAWRNPRGIIVVEGVTDVWRLGRYAAATFGIKFKMEQVLQLSKVNDRFFIIFDEEPQAQKQAKELATKLKALGKQAYIQKIDGDPGEMKPEDAKHLVKELLRGKR